SNGFIYTQNTLVADGCHLISPPLLISVGNNIERLNSCQFTHLGDKVNVNPLIFPPNVNPGPYSTVTHAIAWNSPAADWADPQWCGLKGPNNYDQRGVPRPQGFLCDVGAYERRLDEPMGLITHPGVGFVDNGRCPALRWDGRGRSVPNPCRASADELIRAL